MYPGRVTGGSENNPFRPWNLASRRLRNHRLITTISLMNQVTVEYVDECALGSSYLRRAAAEVVLPHTYSKVVRSPLLRCQQLVLAVDR